MRVLAPVLLAAAMAPAAAQGVDMAALERLEACLGGLDAEAVAARAEVFAGERNIEARVGALCAAGDRDGAAALDADFRADLFAADPDAERMMTCLWDTLGQEGEGHICDQ